VREKGRFWRENFPRLGVTGFMRCGFSFEITGAFSVVINRYLDASRSSICFVISVSFVFLPAQ
jgi:hypothetical protein